MLRSLKLAFRSLAIIILATACFGVRADPMCSGKFVNPITDICWSCMFPLKLAGATLIVDKQDDGPGTTADNLCFCMSGLSFKAGTNVSFWEPIRLFEAVRHPYCFPSLGGLKMDIGVQAGAHGRDIANGNETASFYQAHWYINPIVFYLETLVDTTCLEQNVFDLSYLSELDPLWNDSEATFILNPDASLFTGLEAYAACAVDCVRSSIGMAEDSLFWCAGCQGMMYPLVGFAQAHASGIQASVLLMQRMTNKLHREGIQWAGWGKDGQCGLYWEPIMKKSNYKYQMVWPSRSTSKIDGKCCSPYGRTTILWQAGKQYPMGGEDFAYQIFRKRDCCMGAL